MKYKFILSLILCSFLIFSCSTTPEIPTATIISPTPTTTSIENTVPFPLSEHGPYPVGILRGLRFEDSSRKDRVVSITIWYPAIQPQGTAKKEPYLAATPDSSGAPYPLVLSSSKVGSIFGSHLASYGFTVVGVNGQDSAFHWGQWLTDYPLEIVFALDQVSLNPPEELAGLIDSDHAGAMGYSFDGYTSLALSGARVDPEFYRSKCANPRSEPAPPEWWIDYVCNMTGGWDAFVTNAGPRITESGDELWQPMTDARIRAVIPMAPEGAWLFGERGLAAADCPTLIIGATADDINIYDIEAVYIFEYLGTPDKVMISFIGEGHMMVYDAEPIARMKHFATAFFGYHLKSDETFAEYFSEDFVTQFEDLAWGIYTGD